MIIEFLRNYFHVEFSLEGGEERDVKSRRFKIAKMRDEGIEYLFGCCVARYAKIF